MADVLKILYLNASFNQIHTMKAWIEEHQNLLQRASTPDLLPEDELNGLIENFRFFDADDSGTVSVAELIASNLIDREQ